ncbi:MAG: DUF2807 domain-containing protein [Bacteroidaceae bacterium]|nr:DUF2807 domain-containing protein [Bacteroidaceae bacterium]
MNKKFLAISTLLLTVLSACQNAPKPAQNSSETSQTAAPQPKQKAKVNTKRSHVPIASDFQNIISIGGVNIVYTQGDSYDIELEGDSALLGHVGIDIESGVLTLKVNADSNKDINLYESNYGLTAYITAPGLHCVSLCESGNFTCTGKWESPDIHIGCMSTGRFDVNEIVCETFKYESSDYDKSVFQLIKAQTASIFGYRKCYGTFHVDVDHLELICDGTSNMTITGQAHTKAIEKHGKAVLNDECKEV